jgi:uncharacterized protein YndB with AHSA1/START domain
MTDAGRAGTRVSKIIEAPRALVYAACVDPDKLVAWRVPDGMTGHVHAFDASPGGAFRMSLTYDDPGRSADGKTDAGTDTFQGRFVEVVPGERIVEEIEFESPDPRFAGRMTMTTSFADAGPDTEITVVCHNLPAGVRPEDNELGTEQALRKLAALVTG